MKTKLIVLPTGENCTGVTVNITLSQEDVTLKTQSCTVDSKCNFGKYAAGQYVIEAVGDCGTAIPVSFTIKRRKRRCKVSCPVILATTTASPETTTTPPETTTTTGSLCDGLDVTQAAFEATGQTIVVGYENWADFEFGNRTGYGSPTVMRAVVSYDLSSVPANAIIIYCALSMEIIYSDPYDTPTYIYRLKNSVDTTYATWTRRDSGHYWNTPGAYDSDDCYIDSPNYILLPSGTGTATIEIDATAKSDIQNGLLIKTDETRWPEDSRICSLSGANTLHVTYCVPE